MLGPTHAPIKVATRYVGHSRSARFRPDPESASLDLVVTSTGGMAILATSVKTLDLTVGCLATAVCCQSSKQPLLYVRCSYHVFIFFSASKTKSKAGEW